MLPKTPLVRTSIGNELVASVTASPALEAVSSFTETAEMVPFQFEVGTNETAGVRVPWALMTSTSPATLPDTGCPQTAPMQGVTVSPAVGLPVTVNVTW